jgi:membrane-bound metal-dependent hydrolase YbcI (DUF457 family)
MSLPVAHALVGGAILTTARPWLDFCSPRVALGLAMLLPIVPDFDFAFVWWFGLPVTIWHRTFSHSLVFAAALGLFAALWVRRRGTGTPRFAFWFVFALTISHAVLDMGGHGHGTPGRGVVLFWPVWQKYLALPWQFLPPGRHGHPEVYLRTALIELALIGPPVLLYTRALAAWRARRRGGRRPPAAAPASALGAADPTNS